MALQALEIPALSPATSLLLVLLEVSQAVPPAPPSHVGRDGVIWVRPLVHLWLRSPPSNVRGRFQLSQLWISLPVTGLATGYSCHSGNLLCSSSALAADMCSIDDNLCCSFFGGQLPALGGCREAARLRGFVLLPGNDGCQVALGDLSIPLVPKSLG